MIAMIQTVSQAYQYIIIFTSILRLTNTDKYIYLSLLENLFPVRQRRRHFHIVE